MAHDLIQIEAAGPWGGPVYEYRGARITCLRGAHVCGLRLEGHPLSGRGSFGVPGTITPLIDLWIDEQRLPKHLRATSPAPPREKMP